MNRGRGEALGAAVPPSGAAVPHLLTSLDQGAFLTRNLNHLIYSECFTSVLLYPLCTVSHLYRWPLEVMMTGGGRGR